MTLTPNKINKIMNILTLRHNPLNRKHNFPRLWPADFIAPTIKPDSRYLEKIIKAELNWKIKQRKPKRIFVPLSGGVDSSLILQLVKECAPKRTEVHSISMGFGSPADETAEARKIADSVGGNTFHEIIEYDVTAEIGNMVVVVKEPRWNTYYATVVRFAASLGCDLIITGDGGDELFGGYTHRYEKFLKGNDGSMRWSVKRSIAYLEASYGRDFVPDQDEMFGSAIDFSWDKIVALVRPYFENRLHPLNQMFMADFNGKLVHDYVPTNTAIYELYGIEAFTPLLQPSVITYACSIDPTIKFDAQTNIGKLQLRSILVSKGLDKFMLPQKTGYGPDMVHLWKTRGRKCASLLIGNPLCVQKNIIRREWIDKHLVPEQEDPRYINKLLQIVALEFYLRNA